MTRGEYMAAARISSGLSVEELAGRSGVTARTILRLENDETDGRVETMISLSKALGLSLDSYLGNQNSTRAWVRPAKRVEVFVPLVSEREDPNLFISVNGVAYLLPKGRRLQVPAAVAEELARSRKAEVHFSEMKQSLFFKEAEA